MNCCDDFGNCRQGCDCPARRQAAYPATLPPNLPGWDDNSNACTNARKRFANIASVAGYSAVIMLVIGLVLVLVMVAGMGGWK